MGDQKEKISLKTAVAAFVYGDWDFMQMIEVWWYHPLSLWLTVQEFSHECEREPQPKVEDFALEFEKCQNELPLNVPMTEDQMRDHYRRLFFQRLPTNPFDTQTCTGSSFNLTITEPLFFDSGACK